MPGDRLDDDLVEDAGEYSGLDAFGAYAPTDDSCIENTWCTESSGVSEDDSILTLMFTASNPPETVSVTTLLGGRVHHLDLSPRATAMTEAELCREILSIASLASLQGKAGAHALIAASLGRSGHDSAVTRGYVEHEIGLPSPDTVRAQRAEFFAARYAEDRD